MAKVGNSWKWVKKNLLKRKLFWLVVIIIIIVLFFVFGGGGGGNSLETEKVTSRNVVDVVSQSGTVKSAENVDLSFLGSGRVATVSVSEGDEVKAGQVLAVLENTGASAGVAQAQALLTQRRSTLQKLTSGITDTDEEVLDAQLRSAKDKLAQTKKSQDLSVMHAREKLYSTGLTAYLKEGISEHTSYNATPPSITGTYTGTTTGKYIIELYPSKSPSGYSFSIHGIENGVGTVQTTGPEKLGTKGLYIEFPKNFAHGSNVTWVVPVPNERGAQYTSLKNAYEGAKQARKDSIEGAQNALDAAKASFNQGTAPARSEDIASAQAAVAGARAQLRQAQSQVSGTVITAPFSGVVTSVSVKTGQVSSPGAPAISMISSGKYEIKVQVPEADTGNIDVGDTASVAFDAYDGLTLPAVVSKIAPVASSVNGVTVVSVTLQFKKNDPRIKPGLSADADITADKQEGVLSVPTRAVIVTNIGSFVRMVEKKGDKGALEVSDIKLVPVTTGLRGTNGLTEITSGLTEGQSVITVIPKNLREKLENRLDKKLESASLGGENETDTATSTEAS